MADELSFEDALKLSQQQASPSPTGTPSGEMSFEDATRLSQGASATPDQTPHSTQALQDLPPPPGTGRSWKDDLNYILFDPRAAQALRQSIAGTVKSIPQMGMDFVKGAYAAHQIAHGTPQESAKALMGALGQGAAQGRAIDAGLKAPPGSKEWFDAWTQVGTMMLPGLELFKKAPPIEKPLPRPPIPMPGTEFMEPGPRGFVAVKPARPPQPSGEFVGEPVEQTTQPGVIPDATRVESTGPVPQLEVRPQLGKEAPLWGESKGPPGAEEPVSPTVGALAPAVTPPKAAPPPVETFLEDESIPLVARISLRDKLIRGGHSFKDVDAMSFDQASEAAKTPYFVEQHGKTFAIVDRRKPNDIVGIPFATLEEANERKDLLDSEFIRKGLQETVKGATGAPRREDEEGVGPFPTPQQMFEEELKKRQVEVTPEERRRALPPDAEDWEVQLADLFHREEDASMGRGPDLTVEEQQAMKPLMRRAAAQYGNFDDWYRQRFREPPVAAPMRTRVQDLTDQIMQMRSQRKPVPLALTQELQKLQERAPAELPPEQVGEDPQIGKLETQAHDLQNQVGEFIGKPHLTNKELAVQDRLWRTFDQIHALREKSGQPRDFVIIGGGAGGLKAAGHAAYEGLDTVVLEKNAGFGGQARRSEEIINVGASARGTTGRDYFRARELTARNRGAQLRAGVEVVNLAPRADGGVDVITKRHGVIPARRVAIMTGASVNVHPGFKLAGWGNAERLSLRSRGKTGMVYGAGNSATQAVFGAIRNGAQKIFIVSRHPFGPEVSEDQRVRIHDLEKQGRVQLVTGSIEGVHANPDGSGVLVNIAGQKNPIPVAHLENFLDTSLNTGWLPAGIEKVQLPSRPGRPPRPGPVKVLNASLKTTMPGVYVGGDIRDSLPGEERPRRIDAAEGDAAGIAARVVKDIYSYRGSGKLPEWTAQAHPSEQIDQALKALKDKTHPGKAEWEPGHITAGGTTSGTQAPKSGLTSTPTSPTSGGRTSLPTPTGEQEDFIPEEQPGGEPTFRGPRPGVEYYRPPKKPAPVSPTAIIGHGLTSAEAQQQQGEGGQPGVLEPPRIPPIQRPPVQTGQTGPKTQPAPLETTHTIASEQIKPHPFTDTERQAVNDHEEQLRIQYANIANDQLRAYQSGDQEAIAENDLKLSETLDKFTDLNYARQAAGEPEVPHPPEQFSLDEMLRAKSAVNKGRTLTPFERADVQKWQELIKEKKDALEAYRAGPESKGYWDELRKRAEAYRTGKGPKLSLLPDPKNLKLQADLIRAQKDWEGSLEKDRRAQLTWWQKAPDWLLKWRRGFVISGARSLAKLGAAAVEGTLILPARELVGSGLRHLPLIKEVAERAPREGQGFNIRAEAEAQGEMWKNLISDFGKNLKGQKPDYESVFGEVDQMPVELQNYVGFLHGALKSPLARNEFTRSYQTIAEHMAKNGVDITDPLVQMHIGQKSMESAVFWRLQNRNTASRIYRQITASLDRQGGLARAASVAGQAELPIVTVPSNFLARTFEGVFGAEKGLGELGMAYGRGIEKLSPEQADLIMRNLKTGTLGTALMMIGAAFPQYFGGYYRPGGKKGQQDPSAPKFGGTKIGDYEIPFYLQDNPFVVLPQFGATIAQVSGSFLRARDPDPAGPLLGLWSAAYGAASSQPFVRESIDLAKAGDPRMAADIIGDHARSYVIPQFLQQIAETMDPAEKRYPRGFTQQIMMGIPGMREDVPDVLPKPQQLGARRRGFVPRKPSATVRYRK